MTNLPAALLLGGGLGLTVAAVDAVWFGTAIDIEMLLKYGLPLAGLIWLGAREFQKLKDGQEDLKITLGLLREHLMSHQATSEQLVTAVRELQVFVATKKKTEFIPVDTPHKL
jgi:hypothetical protein